MFKKPKETKHFEKRKQAVRQVEDDNKPLYKMKMFHGAESKVNAGIKNFKTYDEKFFKNSNNLDNLISKVEDEINNLD
jgi:hypothetical protein